ncbi:DUF302 domain-containing protein [Citrobacter freundii]|uniref:DUF302 domain-containing protein n=1 Tax=Citrobacter freundii TaxID=546 RepID=UPI00292AB216|nr:DUF302 domain-containing protein [Citrobacter freundii]MDV1638889.1 DUF302 domain-containing protein [Citrobacter freundii]MDV1718252.1 DUF302 domain-containing protein [Citrobacter freundii]MDV1723247.1 DUF302 domain-containing protein [Citrobacter freundii]MEB0527073.1 DUF302 domain-containing protein [Citrobacter freundii]MEB0532067.1 DUF302 domain-containing protein [Citrobacter freundii]
MKTQPATGETYPKSDLFNKAHAKEAKNAGLTMLPTTVIIFGNPKGGTSLMQAYPDMALDLPFRVLIREESDGRVVVGYHPVEILQTYGPDTAAIQPLKNLEKLVQKAIQ